ncbi:hypothetical protein ACQP1U_06270 [Actinomycetota bacterium]
MTSAAQAAHDTGERFVSNKTTTPEIDLATASMAEIDASIAAEKAEIVRGLEEEPDIYLDALMEEAAARQLELVKDIEPDVLDEGFDAWLEEVESIVDNEVIPEVEERIAEVDSPWASKIEFECDHTSGEWAATIPGHPKGGLATGSAALSSYDTTRELYDALLAEQRAEAAED